MKRFLCWLVLAVGGSVLWGEESVRIIVHPDNPIESIDIGTIRSIYLGNKMKWDSGEKIVSVTLKEGEENQIFFEKFILKNQRAFDSYWRQRIFTGKGVPPITFENQQQILNYIGKNSASISYVASNSEVDLSAVKVLKIEE